MSYQKNDKTIEIFISVALKEANLYYKDRIDSTFADVESLTDKYLNLLISLNDKHGTKTSAPSYSSNTTSSGSTNTYTARKATDKQIYLIKKLLSGKNLPTEEEESIRNRFDSITTKEAGEIIDQLK